MSETSMNLGDSNSPFGELLSLNLFSNVFSVLDFVDLHIYKYTEQLFLSFKCR